MKIESSAMSMQAAASQSVAITESQSLTRGGVSLTQKKSLVLTHSAVSSVMSFHKSAAQGKLGPQAQTNLPGWMEPQDRFEKSSPPSAAPPPFSTEAPNAPPAPKEETSTPLSRAAQDLARSLNVEPSRLGQRIQQIHKDFKLMLLEALFGRLGIRFRDPNEIFDRLHQQAQQSRAMAGPAPLVFGAFGGQEGQGGTSGANIITQTISFTREVSMEQSFSFDVAGIVKTSDGREIALSLSLNMSASFYQKNSETISQTFMDPVVINFNAPSAALSGTKFSFDIDADGQPDQISQLAAGSGFLVLDKNGDGIINNGNELFGARTGNGFAELAEYDADGNGWIDENDAIYDKLRIWIRDEQGGDQLISLGEMGIGAIYLGSAAGDYALGSLANPDAMIRSTGLFLFENGASGTVQQVDFSV